jgi:hypothetical protein
MLDNSNPKDHLDIGDPKYLGNKCKWPLRRNKGVKHSIKY